MIKQKVSIIVPIYCVEEYLERCLDSICNQTYTNLEIILVDDGSTDGSYNICERYSKQDARIRLFSQKNAGVSAARNFALNIATGFFICFVDADDILELDAIEQRVNHICEYDLLITGYSKIDELDRCISEENRFFEALHDQQTMLSYLIYAEPNYGYQGYLWNKLFRNACIQSHHIRFLERVCYNEDRLFVLEYLLYCNKMKITPTMTYRYRIRDGSAMGAVKTGFDLNMLTELKAYEKMHTLLLNKNNVLHTLLAKKMFNCALYWRSKIPTQYVNERKYVDSFMNKAFHDCVFSGESVLSVKQKLKCIYQYLLKKE